MMKRALWATFALSLVVVAAGGLWIYQSLWGTRSPRAVELEIAPGSTAREILAQLHAESLLPSVFAGRIFLKTLAPGQSLYYGHYRFPSASRPVDVLETILEGAVKMFTVTVVEGSSVAAIGEQFAGLGLGTADEWRGFGQRVEWISAFAADAPSLEGFLFPDTYRFAVGIPAERAAHHLVERFEEVWSEEAQRTEALWGSTLEIVTLASLEWRGRLLRIDWEVDDPYNTYRHPGLPPGPINSPGRAALAAAINPQPTPHLYFVAKPGGGHAFSKTLGEHNRAVARLMSSRR
jgi:UPF0755 protein